MIRRKPVSEETARLKMADLCARSEQCEYEISRKLFKMGLPSATRNSIISFLKEEGFIDNARYASSFAHDKALFSSWGPYKIKMALALRKIPASDIKNALDNITAETWEQVITRLAVSKSKSITLRGENGKENRLKLYRYLMTRGFPSDLCVKTIKTLARKETEEE